jgi:hypothetical protein
MLNILVDGRFGKNWMLNSVVIKESVFSVRDQTKGKCEIK